MHAVAIRKSGDTVGHVPRSISTLCSVFIRRGGTILTTPCDRHGIMIKFSNCEEGKLSRFAKIRENRESFPPRMF